MSITQQGGGFEAVDCAARPASCAAYLEVVGELEAVRRFKQRSCDLLALAPGDQVLEVGCGLGRDARDLAARLGVSGRVVATDLSLTMLQAARSGGRPGRVTCACADAHTLGFADARFDACRADRVLQHLRDPEAALAELVRVCRPGGRIVLCDLDWETLVVDVDDRRLARKVLALRLERTRNPTIGSRLARMCRRAGLELNAVEGSVLTLENLTLAEEVLGLESIALDGLERGRLEATEVAAWLTALARAADAGELLAAVTAFTVAAVKT